MNFNQQSNEYNLHGDLTHEIIQLYGVKLKLLKVEKQNVDSTVFGDYSHLKSTSDTFDIFGLPEDSEGFITQGSNFSQFGLFNFDNINVFVSRKSVIEIYPDLDSSNGFGGIMGCLIVLPSGKLMEITDITRETPGANNMFTQNNTKNAYKLVLKAYDVKLNSELDSNINVESSDNSGTEYESLESYFEEMTQDIVEVDSKATSENILPVVDSVFDRF